MSWHILYCSRVEQQQNPAASVASLLNEWKVFTWLSSATYTYCAMSFAAAGCREADQQ